MDGTRLRTCARALCIAAGALLAGATGPPAYDYYSLGATATTRPAPAQPGLLLLGGGDWPADAIRWFAGQAGHGHVVVLRASGRDELQPQLDRVSGGLASVETLVFHDRSAASDPRVLAIVAAADGIFIAGGDQANYVRYWQDTPLSRALEAHVAAGRPLGGTSAGLAILGAYAYGAMDGGSLRSAEALSHPTGPSVTLVRDFLHLPHLEHVITDSHFSQRARLGRLVVFVGRLMAETGGRAVTGIGIDESTALCIDAAGRGTVRTANGGRVWLVESDHVPERLTARRPLTFRAVRLTGIGPAATLDVERMSVDGPAERGVLDVVDGVLRRRAP